MTTLPVYSNDLLFHVHEGLVEILGENEAHEFIRSNESARDDPQTRGILIKAGRAGFYYWLKQNRRTTGWDELTFRLLPIKKKIGCGLKDICDNLETEAKTHIRLKNEHQVWELAVDNDQSMLPCSYLWGFVQEFARWAGIGRFYEVREKHDNFERTGWTELAIKKDPQD